MNTFRITKYDPDFRDESGAYRKVEWTSVSDIGKAFNGTRLTRSEYDKTEKSYLDCLLDLVKKGGVDKLRIVDLEVGEEMTDHLEGSSIDYDSVKSVCESGTVVTEDQIRNVAAANLREVMWCKLESEIFFAHFGFDYYMYVGTNLAADIVYSLAAKYELFAEDHASPYAQR